MEETPLYAEAQDPTATANKTQVRKLTKQFAHVLRHDFGIGAGGPDQDVVYVVSSGNRFLPSFFFGVIAAGGIYAGFAGSFRSFSN